MSRKSKVTVSDKKIGREYKFITSILTYQNNNYFNKKLSKKKLSNSRRLLLGFNIQLETKK